MLEKVLEVDPHNTSAEYNLGCPLRRLPEAARRRRSALQALRGGRAPGPPAAGRGREVHVGVLGQRTYTSSATSSSPRARAAVREGTQQEVSARSPTREVVVFFQRHPPRAGGLKVDSEAMRTRFEAATAARARSLLWALAAPALVAGVVALAGPVANAQTRRPPAKPAAKVSARPSKGDGGASTATPMPAPGPAFVQPGGAGQSDAGVLESKTLDGGHAYKFSELDIEGRLKSPQLVYFLRRVRAEFTAGELGHRSFMREMSETRKESSF